MPKSPEDMEIDSVEDLADPRAIELVDYFVIGGDVYHLQVNDYAGEHYLRLVDEIPKEYWERWNDA